MAADITPFIKDAQRLEKETGIPTSITLGQIILESSGRFTGGLSGLAASAKNLFGVKGTGDAGSVLMPTTEVENGVVKSVQAQFKKYSSYYESLLDHARVLSKPHYQKHLQGATTINQFAAGIKAGGYATDPNYVSKLLGVIGTNNLTQYDSGNFKYTPITTTPKPTGPQEVGGVPSEQPASGTPADNKNTFTETIFFHSVRVALLLTIFVLMIIFFLKAFPAVEDAAGAATNVVPVGKVANIAKTVVKKGVKKK